MFDLRKVLTRPIPALNHALELPEVDVATASNLVDLG